MNYTKIILFGSLFLCKIAISTEPQELLAQWKTMAEQGRQLEIARLEAEYKQIEEEDIQYSIEAWRHEKPHIKRKKAKLNAIKDWSNRQRIDHIKILFIDKDGKHRKMYLQLENSKYHFFIGSGFIYSLFVKPRIYIYDEKEVLESLEFLVNELSAEVQPKIIVYKSNKWREEKGWFFTHTVLDLYSVCIDYSDGKESPSRIDWSRLDQEQPV